MSQRVYTTCSVIAVGCYLYTDSSLSIPVAAGIYSNGQVTYTVNGTTGRVSSVQPCPTTSTTTIPVSTTTTLPTTSTTTLPITSTSTTVPVSTTSTSIQPSTTTTTTQSFILQASVNSVCIQTFTDYTTATSACNLAQVTENGDCVIYYYNSTLCPILTIGCRLYTDAALTIPIVVTPGNYYSNGVHFFQFNASGFITNMGICPVPQVYCSSFITPLIDGTPFDVGGVSTTCSITGEVTTFPATWTPPLTGDVFPVNSPWLGYDSGLYSITFNFASPVNNIRIYQAGGDVRETFQYATNGGSVTLSPINLIHTSLINAYTVQVGSSVMDGSGSSLVTVTSPSPYTSLTISGYTTPPGQPLGPNGEDSNGSIISICRTLVTTTTTI